MMDKRLSSAAQSFVRVGLLILLMLIVETIHLAVIHHVSGFYSSPLAVGAVYLRKAALDVFLYVTICLLLLLIFRRVWPAAIFSTFYLFLVALNTGFFYFTSSFYEKEYATFIDWAFVQGLLIPFTFVMLAGFAVAACAAVFLLGELRGRVCWAAIILCSIPLTLSYIRPVPKRIHYRYPLSKKQDGGMGEEIKSQRRQLADISRNPLGRFLSELFMSGEGQHIFTDPALLADDAAFVGVRLIGKSYPPLNLKPFTKIILVASESLALDLLSGYNSALPLKTSDFYSSPEVRNEMFTNFRTSNKPTLKAVVSLFESHPNSSLLLSGHYENSMVRILKAHGFDTINLRSNSRFFGGENRIFPKLGFDQIISLEDFSQRNNMAAYIKQFGLMDRLLYGEIVSILKEKSQAKVFIFVQGEDTHWPGRRDYADLEYPPPPERGGFTFDDWKLARGIAYQDYDLGRLVRRLHEEGLLTEETLLILTADHSPEFRTFTKSIPGYPEDPLARLPLVFISGQNLPPVEHSMLTSQVDIAPTILHLMNIPIPWGWWGESIFDPGRKPLSVGCYRGVLHVTSDGEERIFDVGTPSDPQDTRAAFFFKSLLVGR